MMSRIGVSLVIGLTVLACVTVLSRAYPVQDTPPRAVYETVDEGEDFTDSGVGCVDDCLGGNNEDR